MGQENQHTIENIISSYKEEILELKQKIVIIYELKKWPEYKNTVCDEIIKQYEKAIKEKEKNIKALKKHLVVINFKEKVLKEKELLVCGTLVNGTIKHRKTK